MSYPGLDPTREMVIGDSFVTYQAMRDCSAETISGALGVSVEDYLKHAEMWCDGIGLMRGLHVADREVVER